MAVLIDHERVIGAVGGIEVVAPKARLHCLHAPYSPDGTGVVHGDEVMSAGGQLLDHHLGGFPQNQRGLHPDGPGKEHYRAHEKNDERIDGDESRVFTFSPQER